jgi:hypothetical protein
MYFCIIIFCGKWKPLIRLIRLFIVLSFGYTPHTLKFGFRYKGDFRDNKDFKDMINNKNRSKNEFSSVMSIKCSTGATLQRRDRLPMCQPHQKLLPDLVHEAQNVII